MSWRPRRGFRVGAMRERITVEQPAVTTTNGEPNRTWSALLSDEPAAFEVASGGETVRGKQVDATVDAVFTIHWSPPSFQVTTECRVVHAFESGILTDTRTYGIVSVKEAEGGRRYLELHCKRDGEPVIAVSE